MGLGNGLQPGKHGRFQAILKNRQNVELPLCSQTGDDRDKVAVALGKRNLVNAKRDDWRKRGPIGGLGNPAIKDGEQGIVADVFLFSHVGQGCVDQLEDQMAFIGFSMQRSRVVPVKRLRGCRPFIAAGTTKAFGVDA